MAERPGGPPVPSRDGLAVVVLTQDEEVNLPDCLASVAGLGGALYVVDSGSSDRTVEIAQAAGATVLGRPFTNYSDQRNWAQSQLPAAVRWVLHLDADERLTPGLAAEIAAAITADETGVDGWMVPKRTVFLGRWIRHGAHYPSWHLRLFRPDVGRCEDRLYDQHFVVSGTVGRLHHDLVDVVASNLTTWTERHLRWARAEADELMRATTNGVRVQPRLWGTPIERRRWLREHAYNRAPLFLRPVGYWVYRYFIRLGFLDGVEGLLFHFLQGLWARMMIDAELWLRSRDAGGGNAPSWKGTKGR